MDHIISTKATRKFKFPNFDLERNWNRASLMEKLLASFFLGQVIKNSLIPFNINIPSLRDLFQVESVKHTQKIYFEEDNGMIRFSTLFFSTFEE